jgi:hypothetical protein
MLYRSSSEKLWILEEAYGKTTVRKKQLYEWRKRFSGVHDDQRCGLPSTATNDENVRRERSDRQKSIQEISAEVRISTGSVYSILTWTSTWFLLYGKHNCASVTSGQKVPYQAQGDDFGASFTFPALVPVALFLFSLLKNVLKGQLFASAEEAIAEELRASRNTSKSFATVGKCVSLPKVQL